MARASSTVDTPEGAAGQTGTSDLSGHVARSSQTVADLGQALEQA